MPFMCNLSIPSQELNFKANFSKNKIKLIEHTFGTMNFRA